MTKKKTTEFVKWFGINKRQVASATRHAANASFGLSPSERTALRKVAALLEHGGDIK